MDVRLCPKCNAKNWPDRDECALCNTSLAGVPLTEGPTGGSAQAAAPAGPQQSPQPTVPTQTPAAQTQQMPAAPPQQGYDPTGLPPNVHPYAPVRPLAPPVQFQSSRLPIVIGLAVVVVLAVIAAYIGAPKKPAAPKDPPEPVVTAFLEAKKSHDLAKVEPFLTDTSLQLINMTFNSRQARSAGFSKATAADMYIFDAPPTIKDMESGAMTLRNITTPQEKDDAKAVIEVTITKQTVILGALSDTSELVLTPEDGKWKIDIPETVRHENHAAMDRLLGGPSKK